MFASLRLRSRNAFGALDIDSFYKHRTRQKWPPLKVNWEWGNSMKVAIEKYIAGDLSAPQKESLCQQRREKGLHEGSHPQEV